MNRIGYRFSKRTLDLVAASSALLVLAPVVLVLMGAVFVTMGRPVFFLQDRAGKEGRRFRIIKFRTMRDALGKDGRPLPDAERLTRFGRFLRATTLDELPELFNVIKGDMSIVGPRPFFYEYLDHYEPWQTRRHEVRPGLTGWAVVHGRNQVDWNERFRLDVWYVDNRSFWLDLKIIFLTLWHIVKRDGISAEGHATAPRFDGE